MSSWRPERDQKNCGYMFMKMAFEVVFFFCFCSNIGLRRTTLLSNSPSPFPVPLVLLL